MTVMRLGSGKTRARKTNIIRINCLVLWLVFANLLF